MDRKQKIEYLKRVQAGKVPKLLEGKRIIWEQEGSYYETFVEPFGNLRLTKEQMRLFIETNGGHNLIMEIQEGNDPLPDEELPALSNTLVWKETKTYPEKPTEPKRDTVPLHPVQEPTKKEKRKKAKQSIDPRAKEKENLQKVLAEIDADNERRQEAKVYNAINREFRK